MQKRFASMILILCVFVFASCGFGAEDKYTKTVFAMDTVISFTAYGEKDNVQSAFNEAESELYRLEKIFGVNSGGDVSEINVAQGSFVEVADEVAELLSITSEASRKTSGSFDITVYPIVKAWGFTESQNRVPEKDEINMLLENIGYDRIKIDDNRIMLENGMAIDFGGAAKGYAAERIAQIFQKHGVDSALISLGGGIYAIGKKIDGSAWNIAVQNPDDDSSYIGTLEVTDISAVTSGAYRRYFEVDGVRYHHIIDPFTGYPAQSDILSVTVISQDSALADCFSTALFVMGSEKALSFHSQCGGFELIIVTKDKEVILTDGIKDTFKLTDKSYKVNEK